MVSNLDLIILALLHGSFISFALLLVVVIILISLLAAFSITLFFIILFYLYDIFLTCSLYFEIVIKSNLELSFVFIIIKLMYYLVVNVLALKPLVNHMVSEFKVKTHLALDQVMALRTR